MRGREKGFTIIELLIYSAGFSMFALTFVYFLTTFFKVSNYQAGSSEIANQANFIVQTIQRQVAGASLLTVNDDGNDEIDASLGQPHAKLVMKNHAETTADSSDSASPVSIYQNGSNIVMKTGNQAEVGLNSTTSVAVTALTFTKISTPPAKDVVLVSFSLQYQKGPAVEHISRQFTIGTQKTSDSIFDNAISPSANGTLDIGTTGSKWRSLFVAATTSIDGKLTWTKTATDAASPTTSILMLKQGTIPVSASNLAANNAVTVITITSADVPELGGVGTNRIFLTPPPGMNDNILYVGSRGLANSLEIALKNTSASLISINDTWSYLIMKGQ